MVHLTASIFSLLAAAQSGPAGYWRADDGTTPTTAADSSGNNRNGTYAGGATTTAATLPPGLFNNASAFQLDGTDDQITVPHNAAFNITGDLTVAFWMRKTAEAGDWQRLVGKGATAVRTFGVWEENGGGKRILFQQYNGSGAAVVSFFSTGTVELNTWTHVACTVSGSACTIYLNGAASGTATRSAVPGTDSEPVRIGYAGFHTYFPGQIDEVRIFNRTLALSEIQTLAGLTPAAVPQNLRQTAVSPGSVTLEWDAAAGANTYVVQRSTSMAGPYTTIATGITGTSYTDAGLTPGATYYYVVYAVGLVDSADSAPFAAAIPLPPPRFNDHEEGLLDDSCACGSTLLSPSPAWAAWALLLLPWVVRRRR